MKIVKIIKQIKGWYRVLNTPWYYSFLFERKGKMKIFLVAGKTGSGKNEVANLIKEYYIYKLQKCAVTTFSKSITAMAMELSDWDGNEATKPSHLFQEIGDKARQIDENYFVTNMIKDIQIYAQYVDVLVISDARMPREIDELKENFNDVYAIYVINQFSSSKLTIEEQSHITETALENYEDFDCIIANDNINTLRDKVFKYLEGIR